MTTKPLFLAALGLAMAGSLLAQSQLSLEMTPKLTLAGSPGEYQIQWAQVLDGATNWVTLTNVTLSGTSLVVYDTTGASPSRRFYRAVHLIPAPSHMVLVPAGSFLMGDTFNEGETDELPLHTVYVSNFYMDQYEVTKALWDEVKTWAMAHDYSFERGSNVGSGKAANHPVKEVHWYDAVKWCNARSERAGRVPAYYTDAAQTTVYRSGKVDVQNSWVKWRSGYRLPSEAEWEYAARGGLSGARFPWGNTITHSQANYYSKTNFLYDVSPNLGLHPAFNDGVQPYTSPVGSFAPNRYGLYDMAGNVWEWCWDWYGSYSSGPQTDPQGPASESRRVGRGGSWDIFAKYCRVTFRGWDSPGGTGDQHGFRSVLPPGQ